MAGNVDGDWADAIASRLAPTGDWVWVGIYGLAHDHCRSEPARESGVSGNVDGDWADAIASRLAPTGSV